MTRTDEQLANSVRANWSLEMDGADMYAALAERERIPQRRVVFEKLAELERKHATRWAKWLTDRGHAVPAAHSGRGHATRVADTPGGMQAIIRAIEEEERRDVSGYLRQLRDTEDEETRGILREVVLDEFAHAHTLSQLYAQSGEHSALSYLRGRERQGTGSWIGDAVYGVNDGLGAIFGIVSGVSGATLGDSKFVLLAGLAGTVASALSMGSGAYLAAKSEREIYDAEVHRERETLVNDPTHAKEELAIFYQLKGVPAEDAAKITEYLAGNPDHFLRTMAAEKLNLTEEALSDPIQSMVIGTVSTAIGAFIPIIPFFFMSGYPAVAAAAVISILAHFAVGAAKSLVTVRSWWSSGAEMTVVGVIEGVITYAIGIALGHV